MWPKPGARASNRSFGRATQVAAALALAWACSRPGPAEQVDPHLERGHALLEREPAKALEAFEQVAPARRGRALYGIGLANEALRKFDRAAEALTEAKKATPSDVGPRTALARVLLFQGKAAEAQEELAGAIAMAPWDLGAVLLNAVTATDSTKRRAALDPLRAWPERRDRALKNAEATPLPAEYLLVRSTLEAAVGDAAEASRLTKRAETAPVQSLLGMLAMAELADKSGNRELSRTLLRRIATSRLPEVMVPGAAELALQTGEIKSAKALIDQLPVHPPHPTGRFLTGRVALLEGDAKQAITALSESLKLIPEKDAANHDRARLLLAEALLVDRQPERAATELRELLKRDPNRASAELLMSRAERELGLTGESIQRLERALTAHPDDAKLVEELGLAHLSSGDLPKAERQFRRLLELSPGDTRPPRLLAQALAKQGRFDDVAGVLEAAANAHPRDVQTLRVLVGHYLERKQLDLAIGTLERRVPSSPITDVVQRLLAATYGHAGRRAEQLETLTALTGSSPKLAAAWIDLARVQDERGEPQAAIDALRRVVELEPRSAEPHLRLAQAYTKAGRAEEAAAAYSAALKIAENDFVALNNAAVLYADELNAPDRAVELAEKALALAPENPSIMDTLGWALTRRGLEKDSDRALTLLRKAAAITKSDVVKDHLEKAERQFGKRDRGSLPAAPETADSEGRRILDELLPSAPGAHPDAE